MRRFYLVRIAICSCLCAIYFYNFHLLTKPRTFRWKPSTGVDYDDEIEIESGLTPANWCVGLKDVYPLVSSDILQRGIRDVSQTLKPVYVYPFGYLNNPDTICSSHRKVHIISVVKSKVEHLMIRSAIRQTWGRDAQFGPYKLVFLLGVSTKPQTQEQVRQEVLLHGDVVQGNFIDGYYNNTYKTTMGIRWISRFCANARFVFFADDDVMVNFQNVINFFNEVPSSNENSLFSGNRKAFEGPVRSRQNKWYVSTLEYPYDCYPVYLSGFAIMTTRHVVRRLNEALPFVQKFKYDDVFLGIVAQKIGLPPQKNYQVSYIKLNDSMMTDMIVCHGFSQAKQLFEMYRNLTILS